MRHVHRELKLACAGGGSLGHIIPGAAVVEVLRQQSVTGKARTVQHHKKQPPAVLPSLPTCAPGALRRLPCRQRGYIATLLYGICLHRLSWQGLFSRPFGPLSCAGRSCSSAKGDSPRQPRSLPPGSAEYR